MSKFVNSWPCDLTLNVMGDMVMVMVVLTISHSSLLVLIVLVSLTWKKCRVDTTAATKTLGYYISDKAFPVRVNYFSER